MIRFSKHAERRSGQRGIPVKQVELILQHADVEKQIGGNCTLIRVSNRSARSVPEFAKLSKIALIWSDTNAQVVTVLPLKSGACGRRYRTKH
jgi:hypothetical protein